MSTNLELKAMAKSQGVKYFSQMSKVRLCKAMGIPVPERKKKPTKFIFQSGSEAKTKLEFVSITDASRKLEVNSGSIFYYIKKNKEMPIRGVMYKIIKV